MLKAYKYIENTMLSNQHLSSLTQYYITDQEVVGNTRYEWSKLYVKDLLNVSMNEGNLWVKYKIITPEKNPENNQPWDPFSPEREAWVSNQLEIQKIKAEGEHGQFMINIMNAGNILEFIFTIAEHENIFGNTPEENKRALDHLEADYLIETSKMNRGAIDVFTFNTEAQMTILFTKLEENKQENLNAKIDLLYLELIEILKEFGNIDQNADMPKQVINILQKVHAVFVPHIISGHTLSSEMPVDAGGTQKP